METIKAAAFAGCLAGTAITVFGISAPENSVKKGFNAIMSLILVIVIMTPFVKSGIQTVSTSPVDVNEISQAKEFQQLTDDIYIKEIRSELEKNLGLYFKKQEISFDNISIDTKIDEYNYLEVSSVHIKTEEQYEEEARNIVGEYLGKNVQVIFE